VSAGAGAAAGDEDSPGLTPDIVKAMTRCGVDLFGFDQLQPGDGRNEAAVWSWAPGESPSSRCAEMRSDGRWYALGCRQKRPVACRRGDGSWVVTARAVAAAKAARECAAEGAEADVPRTGYDNELLRHEAAGRRVLFVSGNDHAANVQVASLIQKLGFAPIMLINPDKIYDSLITPSLAALWLSQLVVFAVYPRFAVRQNKRAVPAWTLAVAASAFTVYGLWTTIQVTST
jgi:hypothetical protein